LTPRLLITRRLPDRVLAEALTRYDVTQREDTEPLTEAAALAALFDYDAILPTLGDRFTAGVFAKAPAPRCRILANFGVGYNHIDVAGAKASGIVVTNTPGAVTDATADIGLTLMLMTARRAGEGERLVRSGQWTGWQPTQMLGMHLSGKRLGIVGMGRIGKAIARRAHYGFGMSVAFHNRSPLADPGLPATQVATLAEAMAQDVVVIAVPGGAGTRHLINAQALAAMQPHGILVNISRGDVIEETALIAALQEGLIGGAGLDVYEHEPMVPDALKALDNAVLLPHLGTAALDVRESMGMMALANLAAFHDGREPPNRVG
jgi:lactate dehydrogenase-like 2-hydroxyacid dehydrogenase